MKNNPEILEIIRGLKAAFLFHGLPWSIGKNNLSSGGGLELLFPSGRKLIIVCRAVISHPTIEKYRSLLSDELKNGADLLFASKVFTQPFIDTYSSQRIHFFSLNGACRIALPGTITYVVKLHSGSLSPRRNSGGSPFVGKGAMLPRLFFNDPKRIWTQADLACRADMTKAYASIILHRMMENGYIRQEDNGYILVAPEKMLDDWAAVYRFNRYIRRQMFAASFETLNQGLRIVADALKERNIRFGFMGSSGAYLRAPYMESKTVMLYAEQIPESMPNLFPVESNGNVILYIPQNAGFFFGGHEVDGYPIVSDVQLYLDMKRMPGRNEDQADYLRDTFLDWGN